MLLTRHWSKISNNKTVHIVHSKYNDSSNWVYKSCNPGWQNSTPRLNADVWEGNLDEVTCTECLKKNLPL